MFATPARLLLSIAGFVTIVAADRTAPAPVSARFSLDSLEAAEGLKATLVAEAPTLTNPTNLDVDARGRIWVLLHEERCASRRHAMSREWHLKRDRTFRKKLSEMLV